ncbi:hypothetical protein MAP00_001462 [Monascus purpureus]|nr:hypothetical protein MAP00_001462 [Monascus purpureus]
MNYKYENGRRYHSFHEGEYFLPNDETEQDRLDLSHHVYRLLLGGELQLAPIRDPKRILDIGTGTGIWAIDFADQHPDAEVIGNDLSVIQPTWLPPNCRFEIDDFEQPWEYSRPFDFIHGRELEGSIQDHDRLFQQAFNNLTPGGYFELATIQITTTSDDGTHLKAEKFLRLCELCHEASRRFGKSLNTVTTWKEKMIQAGFEDVHEQKFKLPQSSWEKDPKLNELGRNHQVNVLESLGPYSYALFTRILGWSRSEIEVFLMGVRKEVKDLSNHLYTNAWFVYGRKPSA